MMKDKSKLEHLTDIKNHMSYYNKMTPFPHYETEYIQDLEDEISKLKKEDVDYDNEPVVACKYCKSLHIITEETSTGEVDICNRCFTVGETTEFKNINEYNNYLKENGYPVYYDSK